MPVRLYDSAGAKEKEETEAVETRIVTGTVVNNCDLIGQGKVLVRLHSIGEEVWCRLTAIGGGSGAGFAYVPRINDEVVVGLSGTDSFILGGLWSSKNAPPVDALQATTKRVIKTGVPGGKGHELEFDDLLKSIKILTSTEQRISLEPTKIEVSNKAGTLQITLDEASQTLTIKGVNVTIEASAALTLKGRKTDVKSDAGPLSLSSPSLCSVEGKPIKLN